MEDDAEQAPVSGEQAQAPVSGEQAQAPVDGQQFPTENPDGVWIAMESIRAGGPGGRNVIRRFGQGQGESRR
jgi:hypothetical protein